MNAQQTAARLLEDDDVDPKEYAMRTVVSEAEEARRGALLADVLGLRRREGRWQTKWGTKTDLGLFRTVRRIVNEGE